MTPKHIVKQKILECGLIPVIRTKSADQARAVAEAVARGGAPLLEITMTVPGALEIIRELAADIGERVVVGAGTILDGYTARQAILAGAEFIIAPTLDTETIRVCHRYNRVAIPGAMTPTEILRAWEAGADFVKIFPADLVGGPGFIKAVKAPLPQVEIVPTGGIDLSNVADYIAAGAAAVGVGSGLIDPQAIAKQEFDRISGQTEEFLQIIRAARGG
jgi:2-dehydro-3-deoxyphosphogluconate aldolase / (4S)-4-hydroxy-2-oxoglutarate aldolase